MLSGLSSKILRTNNPSNEFISGCYLKYFSFSILSSSYNHLRQSECVAYLLLLDLILLCPDDALDSDQIVIIAVEVLGLLVSFSVGLLAIVHLLLLVSLVELLLVTHCIMKAL